MHELSVAMEVCSLAEARLGREALGSLVTVAVEVGDTCGIDPDSLAFCLEALLAEPPFEGASPVIVRRPGDVLTLSFLEVDDGCPDD